jgi:hypothetical protein
MVLLKEGNGVGGGGGCCPRIMFVLNDKGAVGKGGAGKPTGGGGTFTLTGGGGGVLGKVVGGGEALTEAPLPLADALTAAVLAALTALTGPETPLIVIAWEILLIIGFIKLPLLESTQSIEKSLVRGKHKVGSHWSVGGR